MYLLDGSSIGDFSDCTFEGNSAINGVSYLFALFYTLLGVLIPYVPQKQNGGAFNVLNSCQVGDLSRNIFERNEAVVSKG